MNIVQAVETSGPGGAEQVLIKLCQTLQQQGHRVRALLLRKGWLAEQLESKEIGVSILPIAKPIDRHFLAGLREFVSSFETDIFHSHEFTFALYGRLATSSLGVPHVATAHGRNFSRGLKRRIAGTLLLRKRDRFRLVAVSGSLAGHICHDLRLPRRAIDVVPNGIDVASAPRAPSRRTGEPLRLVAVGNLYPVKNHALLIRAVAELTGRGIPATLEILGRGAEEATLRSLIAAAKLEDRVTLQGYRTDVKTFLGSSHVFVSSSLFEGMPLSLLEAMASGLPIVAPRVGGIPEIVEEGREGLLYDSQDVNGLVAALQTLAVDERLRAELAGNAERRAREQFSAAKMLERYSGLYSGLHGE